MIKKFVVGSNDSIFFYVKFIPALLSLLHWNVIFTKLLKMRKYFFWHIGKYLITII